MSATVGMSVLVTGCTTRLYLSSLGVRLSVWEAFWIAGVNFLCSYLPLQLNLLIRAKYLKQLHSLGYGPYTGMVLANLVVMFCAIGVYGLLSLVFLSVRAGRHSFGLYLLFVLCMAVPALAGVVIRRHGLPAIGRARIAAEVLASTRRIFQSPVRVMQAIALTVVALFILSLRFYAAAQHVSAGNRLELALVLPPVATLSTYLAITPSGLGVRELVSSGLTEVLGMDHSIGLAVTTIERAVTVVWFALYGLVGAVILGHRFSHRNVGRPTGTPHHDLRV
jgi:uncharacterized membrane protein YbhN (UPF0104 family)